MKRKHWLGPQFSGVVIRVAYHSDSDPQNDHVDALTPDGDVISTYRGAVLPADIHPALVEMGRRWLHRTA